ncbi:MAG TPA: glycosyltransferase, partial [Flavisolibacter sp.]|nr:glycosyltransferase [Flavisolibacter sp.]
MLTSNQPLISVIALNWNGTAVTCEFLQSIIEHNSYKNIEVIIVDNHSEEDPTAVFKTVYPEVVVIRTEANLGFSGGNNVG